MSTFQYLLLSTALIGGLLLSDSTGQSSQSALPVQAEPFSFETVRRLARERAAKPYKDTSPELPESFTQLGYDEYRDIRYRPASALWRGQSLFEVQFFHRGFNFRERVNIFEVSADGVRPIGYDPALFDLSRLDVPKDLPPETGFAGLRVHYPLHTPVHKDEVIVFLGASYFRMLGRRQVYGLSARGLAVDTAAQEGEEFPRFTDFWLVRPESRARTLTVYGLLDSPSITGAYQFDVRPGTVTQVEVTAELYPRKDIGKLGIAPLTSMFLFGENGSDRRFDDFRPEVHDSDGLLMHTGHGEWLWRPLVNPRELRVTRFSDDGPRGFGLVQRDRNFESYQDNESRFHARPSYWVEPLGHWGKGSVELVEIPSNEEIHDNIVAYWVPQEPVRQGQTLELRYLVSAFAHSWRWPPGGRAIATRIGSAAVGGYDANLPESVRRVVIDFAGGDLAVLDRTQPVEAQITVHGGTFDAVAVEQLGDSGIWRAAFRLMPEGKEPVEMRCYLSLYGEALTETWTYLWSP